MDKKQVDIENVSTLRDSLLMSLIFSNISFVIIFLLFFLKTNNIIQSIKIAFILGFITFIGASILIYIYLDTVLENRIKELNDFNESFNNSKQKELENKQKQILEKIYSQSNTDSDSQFDSFMLNNTTNNSSSGSNNKKINPNVKTQFNLDFENNIQDLSNKMDI